MITPAVIPASGKAQGPKTGGEADPQKVTTDSDTDNANEGTLIIDATCAPSNIRFLKFLVAE